MTTELPPPLVTGASATGTPPDTPKALAPPAPRARATANTTAVPAHPGATPPAAPPTGPVLPRSTGPASPSVAPHTETLPRPGETAPVAELELAPNGLPGSTATPSRRSARYGQPVSPLGRGVVTLCGAAATLVSLLWLSWVVWDRRSLVAGLSGDASVSDADLVDADAAVVSAAVGVAIAALVTGIALMVWMSRAYRNVGAWRPIEYGVGWAVAAWLVPIINLLRPGKIMLEIVEASPTTGRRGGLVWWWWIAWLLPWVGISVIESVDVTTADDFVFRESLVMATTAIAGVAIVLLMVIVGRATNDQRRRLAAAAEAEPVADAPPLID